MGASISGVESTAIQSESVSKSVLVVSVRRTENIASIRKQKKCYLENYT